MNLLRALCLLLFIAAAGCATADGKRSLAPVLTVTNIVETVRTNTVTQIIPLTVTNTANEVRVAWTTNFASVISTNWQTNIVSEVNPAWTTTIQGARALNETLNPTPTAPFVNIGLGVLSGALAWFAGWQNRRRQKETSKLNTVIAGVEAFTKAAKSNEVKEIISETSKLFGTKTELAAHVDAVTGSGANPS